MASKATPPKHMFEAVRRFALCALLLMHGCADPKAVTQVTGNTMGTAYTVRVFECAALDQGSLQRQTETRLAELNTQLSHYAPDSAVGAFNRYRGTEWVPVQQDLLNVIVQAQQVSRLSAGAFDVTLGTAVDAWGFGPAEADLPPDRSALGEAQRHSGYRKLEVRPEPPAIRKLDPLLQLNLSAIGKGYAVDQLAYLLEAQDCNNYLVEIGGETRTAGLRSDGNPWRIGIQPPDESQLIEYVVTPGDAAVATSGDYRNFYWLGDKRIAHTIDPATAEPVANNLASVSVIAPSAMQADAYATMLMVMGPVKGLAFSRDNDIAALFIERTATGFSTTASPGFETYLARD